MPVQRPSRLPEFQKPRRLPIGPSPKTQAASFDERPFGDSEDANSMELDDELEDEPKDHSPVTSLVELGRPMDDSDLRRIDRECFDKLSEWLSAVSLARSVCNGCSFEGTAKGSNIANTAQVPR